MYNSHQISNYFIQLSQKTGKELTPMKLIKLAYIAHGWHLGLFDKQLLDEVIYAWKYGPVIETIYNDFKKYGNSQINELYNDNCNGDYPLPDETIYPFLDTIWKVYGDKNGIELSTLTHQKETPWDIVWNKQGGKNKKYAIIPNDIIREHYKEKIRMNERTSEPNPTATARLN